MGTGYLGYFVEGLKRRRDCEVEMNRNRTRKAGSTSDDEQPGEAPTSMGYDIDNSLEKFLNLNASEAYRRPWHKLERGLRLNRLRRFIESEAGRLQLSAQDTEVLRITLDKAFEKKQLNSKTSVIYDQEKEEITEIKGLVYHKTAEGRMLSKLIEKKAVTFRRKATATAAAQQPQVNLNESQA